jgi:hypothetical protein
MATPDPQALTNLAKLASDIAMDVLELDTILNLNNINQATWLQIRDNPQFSAMLNDYVQSWNAASNTKERIRIKSQTAVEVALSSFVADMMNPGIPLVQRVDALRQLCRLGELEGQQILGGGGGPGFNLTINIGEKKPLVIEAKADVVDG